MTRKRFLSASAIIATLGSGVAAVFLGIWLLGNLLPAYTQPASFNLMVFLFGFSVFIVLLIVGIAARSRSMVDAHAALVQPR